ncbi:MAG: aminopeptidase P family N-terminal domain-containing protein, partial [Candidatus Aminicenantes bacterium]|nr:aminopeptidase P family N-terminal domain-containing protein [Candidatus Aminicenantes bacterium]
MTVNRRDFMKISAGAAGAALLPAACSKGPGKPPAASSRFPELSPMTGDVRPITDEERKGRIERARVLMVENGLEAVYLEGGTSMFYYTGVNWWNSERMFGVVIPARGEIAWICPAFEQDRAMELIRFGTDIRSWEEHESPSERVA